MNVYVGNRLPSTYQEVEYIASSGTQYINTGYNPVATTKVQAKVMITGYRGNGGPIYGVWYNYSGATRFCGWYENGGVWFGYGGNNGSNNIVQCSTNTILNIEQYTSSGTSHNIVNGTDNSYTGASFSTQNYPIYLFARNNGASDIDKRLDTRIYSFKIYTGDTLVRNFVPCYRKSDSVIGLYDLVNNQFYTNSGTGTFSKGSDVLTNATLKNAYIGEAPLPDYLCFTANTAGSTVQLAKTGSPTSVTLETSTDLENWSTYTIGTTITLSNIGDKVYWRNTSTTDTRFTLDYSKRYQFVMTGSIAGSGDINYLLNKNSTNTLSNQCYRNMFDSCTSLTTPPSLPATTLADYCYAAMFNGCTNLTSIPALPATTLSNYCYNNMFYGCSKIKLSTTQTGEYQTPYRIPTTGTGTDGAFSLTNMLYNTGGTFKPTPSINTTYYTSNTVV